MEITSRNVPPGFRFHPTEEELVGYYLLRKISCLNIDLDIIVDIDLYRMEPWDIQEKCNLGYQEQNEWYFFSHKDKKYPTGTRTNRATTAGFWKATGRDKAVFSKNKMIGMRKTLVFYKGRAPNGRKSDWIIHEYRLQTSQHAPPQEEGWVVCRAFQKPTPSTNNRPYGYDPCWHLRSNRSSANVVCPSPLPDLVEFNYNHLAAATTMTSFHHHHNPLPAADDDCLPVGPTNCSLDCNYSQQGFENTAVNEGDGGLFDDYKSGHSWKFINSLLASDEDHISSVVDDQVPSFLVATDPSSQLDSNIINPGYDQLSTADQVAHFLT